ncbi:L-arabinose isomerase [Catalinimonas niigatensis]|uniref:L-arabinose isomerase n=1 Tax=Catalinimonas niigatensis TaxID=1397264 RepID=UPI0026667BDC|nr:L-arabinose isomerase [Catalinimonas niigatensis]WPP53226.1 L-arabinose isomerase [Catalinimonas niigatensis]
MIKLDQFEAWFVTGSQHLYGEETLKQVAEHSQQIVKGLNATKALPVRIVYKPVLTTPDAIYRLCQEANSAENCIGLIAWMHTFSPAKMWIAGLKALQRPLAHLHTQFNRDIPWSTIDMDFMNLNQSAHGGREFGYMASRMGVNRKVIVGHWEDTDIHQQLNVWTRAAAAWYDAQGAKVARFGDNMREVAVTEGDKVAAQMQFGYSVNGYGLGDLVAYVNEVSDGEIDQLIKVYEDTYELSVSLTKEGAQRTSLREAGRIELGMRAFLEAGNFKAFTDTFENLHGLAQLPGIASQRLMADGYGFGAEGDWKTAALVRAMKVMSSGLKGGTSFMEDYTYHFHPDGQKVLGSHMLEICPSIASGKPRCEIHPLSIGGKADPVRLVFDTAAGPALNASVIDMGGRFRLLVNEVEAVPLEEPMLKLPVARVLWEPKPNLKIAASAWILAGGAHHTGYSPCLTSEYMQDFAEMANIEYLLINEDTQLYHFKNELRWNAMYWGR